MVELLSSIAPPDAPAAASYGFTVASLTGHEALTLRSIGDNRSTIPPAVSSMVELLSPIALPDAQAAASYGFKAAFLTGHAALTLRSIIMNLLALGRFLPTTPPPTT